MRIGIDARPLINKNLTGIGQYVFNIVSYLVGTDSKNEYFLYTHKPLESEINLNDRFHVRIADGPWKIGTFILMARLPRMIKDDNIDVFWGTQHFLPKRVEGIRYVLTIHDLALLINPEWGSRVNTFIQRIFTPRAIKNADRIIAVSESTKNDVIRMLHIDESIIMKIYSGVNAIGSKRSENSDGKYFLYVGTIEPRKNIEGIVRAFDIFAEKEMNVSLILAGGNGWKCEGILDVIANAKHKDRIKKLGFVSKERKEQLYRNAIALMFPSHYEGFGFPIVEAMSAGTIVITAKNSSLPEAAGKAGIYVDDENDIKTLADKMVKVYNMTEVERKKISKDGIKQSEKFTWKDCAEQTINVIKNNG